MANRSGQVLAINIAFFVLTWVIVMLRVYTRAWLIKSWGIDDWAMVAALLLYTGYLICQDGGLYYGTGRKDADLEPEAIMKALRYWWFCELFYTTATAMLKVAIGLFLVRIAVKRPHIIVIHTLNAAVVVISFAYLLVFIFQCDPFYTFWTIKPNNPQCLGVDVIAGVSYAASSLGSISDWTFGILPGFIVWDLQMNKRTKLVVVGILAFAAIGSTATLIRMPFITGFEATHDFLYESVDIAIWSTIEPGIGMTAALYRNTSTPVKTYPQDHCLSDHGQTDTGNNNGTSNWTMGNKLATKYHTGYIRSPEYGLDMDSLNPSHMANTTTVTGGNRKIWRDDSDGSSEEHIISTSNEIHISKSVNVIHVHQPTGSSQSSEQMFHPYDDHGKPRTSNDSLV